MDDFRIYTNVLTDSEVSDLGKRPIFLIAHLNFEDTSNFGKDVSGKGNNFSIGNSSNVTSATGNVGSTALDINNTYLELTHADTTDLSLFSFTITFGLSLLIQVHHIIYFHREH